MLEREVTDVAISTFASFLLIQLVLSPTLHPLVMLGIVACIIQIGLNFLHLILKQLNRMSDQGSLSLVIINVICLLSSFLAFILGKPTPVEGFWDLIPNGYYVFAYILMFTNLGLIFISKNADTIEF